MDNFMHLSRTALITALLLFSNPGVSGEYSDSLSKCLTSSTTPEDKTTLVRWIFGAVASHPDVSDIANLTPEKWEQMSKDSALVFQTLITETCASESRAAIVNEGMDSYTSAFETLGAAAAGGLMSNPAVVEAMGALQKHIDGEKVMKALMTGTSQAD